MSLDSLPDEVLEKILYAPLVNDDPILTTIEAQDIYHAYLDCLEYFAKPRRNHGGEYLNKLTMQGITERRPAISVHLLGVCKRWYRLGCPLFSRYNTFVVMQDDLAKFAKQIGGHNSTFLKAVDMTVHHQDLNPGDTMSLLPKTRFEHVETFNIILASRQSRLSSTSAGQGSPQDLIRWIKMRDKARCLRSVIYNHANSSGGEWTVVEPDRCLPIAYITHSSFVTTAFWTLKRISTPSKEAVLGEPSVPEGGPQEISPVRKLDRGNRPGCFDL